MKPKITSFSYDRQKIGAGIVHIGVGNFHRAHQEFYTNKLLEFEDQHQWGICGLALLPSDEKLVESLKSQNNEYTLTVCGRKGDREVYNIGSMVELIWGVKEPEKALAKMANQDTKIISMTITEGGYNIDKKSGNFDFSNALVADDLKNPQCPKSVFGFVAEALRRRKQAGNGPITILSCDNLQHNGETAERAFMSFFKKQDMELYDWAKENVTFPNAMVDRIAPAVSAEDVVRLNAENGTSDKAPVYSEDFIQWVIEDNFAAERPEWESVGVQFTDDVSQFENMKLSLLNASHTMLSYPAFLMGYRKVDEAMQDKRLLDYIEKFMDVDITPYVPAPEGVDLKQYKETLIERFNNKSVSDQLTRLCFDGISKIPVYIMPNLEKMIRSGADITRLAFFVAAYRYYLKYQKDEKGTSFDVKEPWLTDVDIKLIKSDNAQDFLDLSPFNSNLLVSSKTFVETYKKMVDGIEQNGISQMLVQL